MPESSSQVILFKSALSVLGLSSFDMNCRLEWGRAYKLIGEDLHSGDVVPGMVVARGEPLCVCRIEAK